MADHHKEILAKIAHDLSDAFREKLFALGYKHVSVTYSPHAPKENPERFLPDYSEADVKATVGMSEELIGPMGPRGFGEVMRPILQTLVEECVDVHDSVSNNIVKPNPPTINITVDKILEAVFSEFELYRKPIRPEPNEYSGEGVWTDPEPTGKFDKNLLRQQLASNYTKRQPIVVCTEQNPLFNCMIPFCPNHGRTITIVSNDEFRKIARLYREEGMSELQIAEKMGVTPSQLRALLSENDNPNQ